MTGLPGKFRQWPPTTGSASHRSPRRVPSSSTSVRPMSPSRCTSAICAARSSATPDPAAAIPGTQGHHRQPPRRLGHAVRHHPVRLQEPSRRGRLQGRSRQRAGPALRRGSASRLQKVVKERRRAGRGTATIPCSRRAEGDGQTARRRPGKSAPLAEVHAVLLRGDRRDLSPARCAFRSHPGRELLPSAAGRRGRRYCDSRASPRRAKERSSSSSAKMKHRPLIRKRDGAFTYTTTDLATIRYRREHWNPDAILYVVDFRRGCISSIFSRSRALGIRQGRPGTRLVRTVIGQDGRPYQDARGRYRRPGALLDEAIAQPSGCTRRAGREQLHAARRPPNGTRGIAATVRSRRLRSGEICRSVPESGDRLHFQPGTK